MLALRFLFVEIFSSGLSGFRSSSSDDSLSSWSSSLLLLTMVEFASILSANGSVSSFGLCS